MNKTFFVVIFWFISLPLVAQRFSIKGTAQDSLTSEKLLSGTVF